MDFKNKHKLSKKFSKQGMVSASWLKIQKSANQHVFDAGPERGVFPAFSFT
jgi:hypothetical protein